jgi:hypothetical protein
VFDALELTKLCGITREEEVATAAANQLPPLAECEHRFYVDAELGADGNDGVAEGTPFQSVHRAIAAARAAAAATGTTTACVDSATKTIVLAGGMHYLNTTMTLTAADSNTAFVAGKGGMPWLSGGRPLLAADTKWSKVSAGSHIYKTKIPAAWGETFEVEGLFTVDGVKAKGGQHARMTRARFPNSDPEIDTWGFASPGTARVFRQKFTLEDAIGSHACPLQLSA